MSANLESSAVATGLEKVSFHSNPKERQWQKMSLSHQWVKFTVGFMSILVCSVTQWCLILCEPTDCSMTGLPVLHHLPELAQTHVHWVGSSHQVAKVLELLHHSISPSNEYWRLISFGVDWFDLLAAQGTLKSLLQHYSPKLWTTNTVIHILSCIYMNKYSLVNRSLHHET